MKDFMGLVVHTTLFDPVRQQFTPITSLVRDYHNMNWDVSSPSANTNFPMAVNGVNWGPSGLYGRWANSGYSTLACINFDSFSYSQWGSTTSQVQQNAYKYGYALASYFGSNGTGLLEAIQIGNEPSLQRYSDTQFRRIFEYMARGIRDADPNMKIVTCNVTADSTSGTYARRISLFNGIEQYVDVFATHTYPLATGWPTWSKSHPEDPAASFTYLTDVQRIINYRNNDPDMVNKQVWITEFGYDASTGPQHVGDEFALFEDVTDTQQAQYLVRSYLNFAAMDVDRAYLYWFNDDNNNQLHGSSGLTRNGVPKQSYWAVAHLQSTLGDYAFKEAVRKDSALYVFSFAHTEDPSDLIYAVWSPTGNGTSGLVTLDDLPGAVISAELMPLTSGPASQVSFTALDADSISLIVGESPVYLKIAAVPEPGTIGLAAIGALGLLRRSRRPS